MLVQKKLGEECTYQMKKAGAAILSSHSTFTGEKARGALVSMVNGGISVGLNLFGVFGLGLSVPLSAFLFLYLVGGTLGYSLDIVFAKRDFLMPGAKNALPSPLPYSDLSKRFRWLLRSFGHRYFLRFIVTIIIETLTGLAMLDSLIRAMNARRVLMDHPLIRDATLAVLVAVVTFFLFGNILRFDWAYQDVDNPTMTIVVLAWLGVSMLVFSIYKSSHRAVADAPAPDPDPAADAAPAAAPATSGSAELFSIR